MVFRRCAAMMMLGLLVTGCATPARPGADISVPERARSDEALAKFAADERLAPFFDQAVVIAVYPSTVRAAFGFGAAYGDGLVYRDAEVIGRSRQYQLSFGVNFGGQLYRQILFFRSEEAFERLMAGAMEFAGQANLALAGMGGSATPSFNTDVALFTQLRGGALLEGSVGGHSYTFRPLKSAPD
jgi:lipid-binding SYLF domain-containing protein